MSHRRPIFSLVLLAVLFGGMAGPPTSKSAELKAEIRLKIYNEAIRHYEKAKSFYHEGRSEEALRELTKATQVVNAFPEAYDLARKIYQGLGRKGEAQEQETLYEKHGGGKGGSLYNLRNRVAEEIIVRQRLVPSPDISVGQALLFSGLSTGLFIFGMFFEYRRIKGKLGTQRASHSLILQPFHEEEGGGDVSFSWVFKLCLLFLPAPFLFLLLVALGVRHYADLVPVLLFGWALLDLALYLIYFADFSDLGQFRRPGGSSA